MSDGRTMFAHTLAWRGCEDVQPLEITIVAASHLQARGLIYRLHIDVRVSTVKQGMSEAEHLGTRHWVQSMKLILLCCACQHPVYVLDYEAHMYMSIDTSVWVQKK